MSHLIQLKKTSFFTIQKYKNIFFIYKKKFSYKLYIYTIDY